MSDEPTTAAPLDPVEQIENALAEIDPSAMVVGFVTAVEWLESDGSRSMSVLHTKMAPWHMYGLLSYARDQYGSGEPFAQFFAEEDDEHEGEDF